MKVGTSAVTGKVFQSLVSSRIWKGSSFYSSVVADEPAVTARPEQMSQVGNAELVSRRSRSRRSASAFFAGEPPSRGEMWRGRTSASVT